MSAAASEPGVAGAAPIDWLTFDCYGTLVDWERGIADALAPFLPESLDRRAIAGRYIARERDVEGGAYRPYRDVLAEASARLLGEMGRAFPPGRERALPESLPAWPPFPEVPGALRAARALGCRLAILSNVDRDLIAASIARLGVEPDLLVTAEECRSYKPAPGHWRTFLERSGASAGRTLHVGASLYHDMVPAARLGLRTVFVNRNAEPVVGAAPTRVLPDLADLPRVVRELSGGQAAGAIEPPR
jgi:2-haloalkanoic acid dehalogenase type II